MIKTEFTKTENTLTTTNFSEFYNIPEYEGLYKISRDGDILSLNYANRGYAQVLRQYVNNKGYNFVRLVKDRQVKGKTIHRLLAQTFIHNPEPSIYTDVNHLDENPQNNELSNLEWVAHKDNLNHGTSRIRTVLAHCKSVAKLNDNGEIMATYNSIKEAGNVNNINPHSISAAARGKLKTAGGYRWMYTNEPPKTVKKLYEQPLCVGEF